MKRSSYLTMIEMAVMIPVFALVCAAALKLFAWSWTGSEENKALARASLAASNRAELIKSEKSISEKEIFLDKNWCPTETSPVYVITAEYEDSESALLKKAQVSVAEIASGRVLFTLDCAWQVD